MQFKFHKTIFPKQFYHRTKDSKQSLLLAYITALLKVHHYKHKHLSKQSQVFFILMSKRHHKKKFRGIKVQLYGMPTSFEC